MLIRSQDKRYLVKLKSLTINKCFIYPDGGKKVVWNISDTERNTLGIYSTEEKAIRVIDMIEEEYHRPTYVTNIEGEYEVYGRDVFHMPEDTEVIV